MFIAWREKIDLEDMPTKEKTSAIRRGDFVLSITI
jgi:hypothetical protein